jgi:hypothetical protein
MPNQTSLSWELALFIGDKLWEGHGKTVGMTVKEKTVNGGNL